MSYLLIICLLVLIDLSSKHYVINLLKDKKSQKLFGKFYLLLVFNKGATYGLLKKRPFILKFFILVAIGILIYLLDLGITQGESFGFNISLTFILGGALGNFIDRIIHGVVTDFLYFKVKHLPVFNLADVFIFFPSIYLIYYLV